MFIIHTPKYRLKSDIGYRRPELIQPSLIGSLPYMICICINTSVYIFNIIQIESNGQHRNRTRILVTCGTVRLSLCSRVNITIRNVPSDAIGLKIRFFMFFSFPYFIKPANDGDQLTKKTCTLTLHYPLRLPQRTTAAIKQLCPRIADGIAGELCLRNTSCEYPSFPP